MQGQLLLLNAATPVNNVADGVMLLLVLVFGIIIGFVLGFYICKRIYINKNDKQDMIAKNTKITDINQEEETVNPYANSALSDDETVNPYSVHEIEDENDRTVNPYRSFSSGMDDEETVNPYFNSLAYGVEERTVNPYVAMGGIQDNVMMNDGEMTNDPYHKKRAGYPHSVLQYDFEEEETINPYSIHFYASNETNKTD